MPIRLTDERRDQLVTSARRMFQEEFERDMSDFQAQRLIDFLLIHLGPPVYNQAVQDARAYIQLRLDDLDGEVYEPEALC